MSRTVSGWPNALQVIRQHPTTDAGSRLDVLRALTPTLEAVFTEWTQAGERDDAVRQLGERRWR